MSLHKISCPARTTFRDAEIAELEALENGVLRVERSLWCYLQEGHAGLYHTLTQGLHGTEHEPARTLWTRWPDGDEHGPLRETLALPPCAEKFLAGTVEEECCGLYEGHAGRHGFEFGPPITEADITPDWVLRLFEE
ncbi:hypothetical protein [Streptomyces cacaoi]